MPGVTGTAGDRLTMSIGEKLGDDFDSTDDACVEVWQFFGGKPILLVDGAADSANLESR